eukprot:1026279-Karenia_brevis.AAC.1
MQTYAPLRGPSTSSTRPELLALILATLAPRAIHMGIDNLTVVRKANKFLSRLMGPTSVHPPNFAIIGDGDLWRLFWNIAAAKGPSSIRVTKVKGHALWEDVKHSQEL